MKKYFVILFLLISTLTFSQNEVLNESVLNNKANAYLAAFYSNDENNLPNEIDKQNVIKEKNLASYCVSHASEIFKLLINKYPTSEDLAIYLFYIAELSGNITEKKDIFLQVNNLKSKWGYYIRKSYIQLASIAVEENKFEMGLFYLNEVNKLGKVTFDCGVEQNIDDTRLDRIKEACKNGLKN